MVTHFTLRLFFFGLIALVNGRDGKSLTILLYNDPPVSHHGHVPMLMVKSNSCLWPAKHWSTGWCSWRLSREEIRVDGGAEESMHLAKEWRKRYPMIGLARNRLPENHYEGQDFSWIADMGELVSGAATVDPLCLSYDRPSDLVIARAVISRGVASTCSLSACKQSEERIISAFQFKTTNAPQKEKGSRQALADGMVVEIPVESNVFTLVLRDMDTGVVRTVEIEPYEDSEGNFYADAIISNIHDKKIAPGDQCFGEQEVGYDFALLYGLLKNPLPMSGRFVPHRTEESRSAAKVQVNCSDFFDSAATVTLCEVKDFDPACRKVPGDRPVCPFGVMSQ